MNTLAQDNIVIENYFTLDRASLIALEEAILLVQHYLQSLASDRTFDSKIGLVFSESFDLELARRQ